MDFINNDMRHASQSTLQLSQQSSYKKMLDKNSLKQDERFYSRILLSVL